MSIGVYVCKENITIHTHNIITKSQKNISSHYDILFLHHQQIGFLYCVQYAFGILTLRKNNNKLKNYGRQNASRFSVVLLFFPFSCCSVVITKGPPACLLLTVDARSKSSKLQKPRRQAVLEDPLPNHLYGYTRQWLAQDKNRVPCPKIKV